MLILENGNKKVVINVTKEKYKNKMCKTCINNSKECIEEEIIQKAIEDTVVTMCKNYHNFASCIKKSCNRCGICGKE